MKKPWKFNEKSTIVCANPECNAKLKMNIVHRKKIRFGAERLLCYKCYKAKEAKRGHRIKAVPFKHFKRNRVV